MKLVTYRRLRKDEERLGALLDDGSVLNLQRAHRVGGGALDPALQSMQALIESGPAGLERVRALMLSDDPECRLIIGQDVCLLSPLPRPEQLRDCMCFKDHMIGCAEALQHQSGSPSMSPRHAAMIDLLDTRPLYCKSNRFAVIGTEQDVFWPSYSEVMDYELEMAAVLWRSGKNMTPADVRGRIFGYTIFNDFTARDTQIVDGRAGLGPLKSKDFDGSNVLGPCVVTADAFDPYNCVMTVRVNGEIRSRGHSNTMTWSFEEALSLISQEETLYAGEVFGSGTVGGGSGLEQGRYLQDGDVIELEIEGIGTLRNRIRVN